MLGCKDKEESLQVTSKVSWLQLRASVLGQLPSHKTGYGLLMLRNSAPSGPRVFKTSACEMEEWEFSTYLAEVQSTQDIISFALGA